MAEPIRSMLSQHRPTNTTSRNGSTPVRFRGRHRIIKLIHLRQMATKLDRFEAQGGEPWQVTQAEWVSLMGDHFRELGQDGDPSEWEAFHQQSTQSALNDGLPVTADTLASYPGMRAVTKEEQEERYNKTTEALNSLLDRAAGVK